ncbi:HAD-IIIC family phosphatase [Allorhizobium sp. BGMRC 0089]|uniref:HAD-IIIC family phosphatase n=1 Tax=Allorhizobium sonneratiae TaxID=2934936 RepID=UPI002033D150|nr:HAD-IIIC family phosphatase [Allorhizobium sonneratiae]MCM2293024.1 HAD-IIIC family phosphatase [Allorhizobium sonneratiae]
MGRVRAHLSPVDATYGRAVDRFINVVGPVMENIRLIIWDLDETFWEGTLTEGGIRYNQKSHDIVIELSKRGIINSICSKNDLEQIKPILSERGLWEYFVLPSINWEPKGQRIAKQIELFQLRPETVLFIDDNPSNLGEALTFVPGIQVADEKIINSLLDDPRLIGKNDSSLSRLQQYKVLEQKHIASEIHANNPRSFLLDSQIVVEIDHDLIGNEDRIIELINRTNQLNFTKKRLPENIEEARLELRRQVSPFSVQGGVVKVKDRYGDYGAVGFYLMKTDGYGSNLLHYCFSCRTLNMGVEAYIYQLLGKPKLNVVGKVLTDLDQHRPVDWINLDPTGKTEDVITTAPVVARGGCDLSAITHYFTLSSPSIASELVTVRAGIDIRFDHSLMLHYCMHPPKDEVLDELVKLGYQEEDFRTKLDTGGPSIRLLGLWGDANFQVYRHKRLGFETVLSLVGISWGANLIAANPQHVLSLLSSDEARTAYEHLRENYDCVGMIPFAKTRDTILEFAELVPEEEQIIILMANENTFGFEIYADDAKRNSELNSAIRSASENSKKIKIINTMKYIYGSGDIRDLNHFDRNVYHNIYKNINGNLI